VPIEDGVGEYVLYSASCTVVTKEDTETRDEGFLPRTTRPSLSTDRK
jgi:hypothetical protein